MRPAQPGHGGAQQRGAGGRAGARAGCWAARACTRGSCMHRGHCCRQAARRARCSAPAQGGETLAGWHQPTLLPPPHSPPLPPRPPPSRSQVERVVERGTLHPKLVHLPGAIVDKASPAAAAAGSSSRRRRSGWEWERACGQLASGGALPGSTCPARLVRSDRGCPRRGALADVQGGRVRRLAERRGAGPAAQRPAVAAGRAARHRAQARPHRDGGGGACWGVRSARDAV